MSYDKDQKSRIVVVDIETVSETADPRDCFDAMTGRIVSIAMVIDNGFELKPVVICDQDETKILETFWANLTRDDLIVGHNCLDFDIKYLKQRSWIKNVKPTVDISQRKYWIDDVFDIMAVWTNWGYKNQLKGSGLDNIAKALGLGGKTGHGSEVAALWANKEYVKLMDYNLSDVLLSYQVYCRMTYRAPLPFTFLGSALPTFLPGDTREKVPVPQKKELQAPLTLEAPVAPSNQPCNAPSVPPPSSRNGKSHEPIFYRQAGGEVILSGKGTFQVKRAIKEIYGGFGKKISERPALYEWHMRPERFEPFADFCRGIGVPLQAMGNGTMTVRREA